MARFRYGPDSIRALSLESRIEMLIRYTEGPETAAEVAEAYGLRSGQFVKNFARNHTVAELTLKRIKQEEAREAAAERKANPPKPVHEQPVRAATVVARQRVAVPLMLVKRCGTVDEPKPPHPILETHGKWTALDAYAKANGCTVQKAQQLWHQARVGL